MKAIDAPNYKITGHIESPENIPYNVYLFHKKETITLGELRLVEYYRNYTPATAEVAEVYSDLILTEARVYVRNSIGLVSYRIMTISWYLDNNTIGFVKVSEPKYYNTKDAMAEAETRRKNLLADAKMYTLKSFSMQVGEASGMVAAMNLLTLLNTEIQLYIQGQKTSLITAIQNNISEILLTSTIKTNIITILDV